MKPFVAAAIRQEEELHRLKRELEMARRGSQYTGLAYQAVLSRFHIQVSMSKKGDCYYNAMMESFFSSLKTECVDCKAYQSRSEARLSIFEWIEVLYNRQRRHSSLAYASSITYKLQGSRVQLLYESRGRSGDR